MTDQTSECPFCHSRLQLDGWVANARLNPTAQSDIAVFRIVKQGEQRVLKVAEKAEALVRESLALRLLKGNGAPRSSIKDFFKVEFQGTFYHCLTMDWIEGQDLEAWARQHSPISEQVALDFLEQLATVLARLHTNQFIHRDVKPENIIISPSGRLSLIDFSNVRQISQTYLARLAIGEGGGEQEIVASAYYVPDEQIRGQPLPQSDFFALGRTLIRLLTGVPLSDLPQKNGLILWQSRRGVSQPFANLIDQLQALNPQDRPATGEQILLRCKFIRQVGWLTHTIKLPGVRVAGSILFGCLAVLAIQLVNQWKANSFKAQGDQLLLAEESAAAIQAYQKGLEYNPNNADLLNNLAVACREASDYNCAISANIHLNQVGDVTYYNVAVVLDDLQKYSQARDYYRREISFNGTQVVESYSALARLANLEGNYEGAKRLINYARKEMKKRDLADATFVAAQLDKNLAWAELGLENFNRAELLIQKSLNLAQTQAASCLLAKINMNRKQKVNTSVLKRCLISDKETGKIPEIARWQDEILNFYFPNNQ
ncbi:MAG TPA: protein kinase [Leptolyngbyaceae cyanobacterium M33_DOE_097]|uniref:non-specific serine/threonine protein kinase n=1 Tax=Oscillatoriales cyanobacterium SpSt-418 TaxID=2282169 RepID=A0A7C3KHF1_9CYAN|nr:protein kinase [Leptolyngbyaceae cyanobacterium M33_DOE_097]